MVLGFLVLRSPHFACILHPVKYLSLDIGTRRTGVAFADEQTGIPLPLPTLEHRSVGQLLMQILELVHQRRIDEVIVGLPLLPGGQDGSQAVFVREIADTIRQKGIIVHLLDERHTTPRSRELPGQRTKGQDTDASAACTLLGLFLERKRP